MAQETLYALTADDLATLRRMRAIVENPEYSGPGRKTTRNLQASRIVIGILTDSVAATTGLASKPKVGTLNIYGFTSTGTTDTGYDEKCYNFAPQAATTDRWTVCERDAMTGKLIITTQFCS